MISLQKTTLKAVNCEGRKVQEVIQYNHENPSQFLGHLLKASYSIPVYHKAPGRKQLFTAYCFSKNFPDTRATLKYLERGPLTPQAEVLVLDFKVYHGRDEKAREQK